jgi:MerR family mercuric resistance operon transcriptional regulator
MARPVRLSRGRLARETGVNLETIRYYEKSGLLNLPSRTEGGHRIYGPEDIDSLRFVKRARELGFSPKDVRTIILLQNQTDAPCAKAREVAASHLEQVRAKIADLKQIEALLSRTIADCSDDPAGTCPVFEMLGNN